MPASTTWRRPLKGCTRGIALVAISLGPQGALFLSDEGALIAGLAVDRLASTVGAGDAMVAGIVAASLERASLARIARLATAFAVAKLGETGPNLPPPATVNAPAAMVDIVSLDAPGLTSEYM